MCVLHGEYNNVQYNKNILNIIYIYIYKYIYIYVCVWIKCNLYELYIKNKFLQKEMLKYITRDVLIYTLILSNHVRFVYILVAWVIS